MLGLKGDITTDIRRDQIENTKNDFVSIFDFKCNNIHFGKCNLKKLTQGE